MNLDEEKYFVGLGMRTYGGSFVHGLGIALLSADSINILRIKTAFPEYWEKYLKMGKIKHKEFEGE